MNCNLLPSCILIVKSNIPLSCVYDTDRHIPHNSEKLGHFLYFSFLPENLVFASNPFLKVDFCCLKSTVNYVTKVMGKNISILCLIGGLLFSRMSQGAH